MNLLDTDALSHLQKYDPVGAVIDTRLAASSDPDLRITTVSVYEMLRGAFNLIHELRKKHKDLIPGFDDAAHATLPVALRRFCPSPGAIP